MNTSTHLKKFQSLPTWVLWQVFVIITLLSLPATAQHTMPIDKPDSASPNAASQSATTQYHVFRFDGQAATIDDVLKATDAADVVFIGEEHDDPVAHTIQSLLFIRAHERVKRRVAVSLEMFERDVQTVLNEYLKGLITESHFLQSSRPWNNYATDYRPLIEYARTQKLDAIAANAPRRYVNRVGRMGRDSLNDLSAMAKTWLAPLPLAAASTTYAAKFSQLMGGAANDPHASSPMLEAQSLWDATMAYSIAEYLKQHPSSLVLHLNGKFHTESRLGIPEHLARYLPKSHAIVVTIVSAENFQTFDSSKHRGLGDFVILTDKALPRSR